MYVCIYLSISLSINLDLFYLFICPSIYPYQPMYISMYQSICLFIYQHLFLSTYIYLSGTSETWKIVDYDG